MQLQSRATSGRSDAGPFLDTYVLFASASDRDDYHTPARQILRGIDQGDLPDAVVTNDAVAETLNLTGEQLGPDAANEMLDRLIEGGHFESDHARKTGFNAAHALFRRNAARSSIRH